MAPKIPKSNFDRIHEYRITSINVMTAELHKDVIDADSLECLFKKLLYKFKTHNRKILKIELLPLEVHA